MSTIAAKQVSVNLDDNYRAVIGRETVSIEDAAAHTPVLVTAMSLDDAIAVAKAILAFAEGLADEAAEQEAEETYARKHGRDEAYVSRWE